MKILMLAQFYKPIIGGEERHVQDLSIELVRRGHQVSVATLRLRGENNFEVDQGVKVFRLPSTTQRADWLYSEKDRRHAPPIPDPETVMALIRLVRQEKPDIIHAHNWLVYSFLPIKDWTPAPLILTLHDTSLVCAKKRLFLHGTMCSGPGFQKCLACASEHYGKLKGPATVFAKWSMSILENRTVDFYLAVSQSIANHNRLPDRGLPFQVVPNFIADEVLDQPTSGRPGDTTGLKELPEDGYLLYVGDISHDKGASILLEAYRELKNAPPLVLIGRNYLDIPAILPPNTLYLGRLPHHLVIEAWRRSSIGLVPSVLPEAFGIAAIEAMACGSPVVASRIGGLAEVVIDGKTGILVEPGDVQDLARAIQKLIDHPQLRNSMGANAKKHAANYRASEVVQQIESIYIGLVSKVISSHPFGVIGRPDQD